MKSYEIDMVHGPLLKKIIVFAIPVILSGALQLLFNAADIVVVGRFAGSNALAAVGSTTALINLLVNMFVGLSIGVNVLVGQYLGANEKEDVDETIHTAIATSILGGLFIGCLGIVVASPILHLMGTPDDVISLSVLYMCIFFVYCWKVICLMWIDGSLCWCLKRNGIFYLSNVCNFDWCMSI